MVTGAGGGPEALTLTILGCDGSYAGPGGASTGYLLRSPTTTVWLDCGPGTLGNVQRHVALTDLDAVVVTHEHPDHCLELPVLRNALRYVLEVSGLRVITTAGTRALVDHISDGAEPTFDWDVVGDGDQREVGDLVLRFARTDHPVETLAVRVDARDRSFAFSSDTGGAISPRALDPDGSGVDLALVEATVGPEHAGQVAHLSGAEAARLAVAAGARRLLLTHLTPGSDPERRRQEALDALVDVDADLDVAVARLHDSHQI